MKTAEELKAINKNRTIDQVCFVTDDLWRTIKYFTEKLDYGPWTIIKNSNESAYDVKKDGKPVEEPWNFYLAFTMVGNMDIEVIQPDYGPNPYSDFLEKKGPGVHHIKESIYTGNDKLFSFIEDMEARGHVVNYEGKYKEDIYYYLDTGKYVGADYEVGNSAVVSGHPQLIGYYPES